jgi:hypothetical protein
MTHAAHSHEALENTGGKHTQPAYRHRQDALAAARQEEHTHTPTLQNADRWTHKQLKAAAAGARRLARTTKGPLVRTQARADARSYQAEIDRRANETASTAEETITRYGHDHAGRIAHAIFNQLRAPNPQPTTR